MIAPHHPQIYWIQTRIVAENAPMAQQISGGYRGRHSMVIHAFGEITAFFGRYLCH
jgi:hypothetical protein